MPRPAVFLLSDDAADLPWMDELRRGIAQTLSRGADGHRAAGDHETANVLDAASIRFDPLKVN